MDVGLSELGDFAMSEQFVCSSYWLLVEYEVFLHPILITFASLWPMVLSLPLRRDDCRIGVMRCFLEWEHE